MEISWSRILRNLLLSGMVICTHMGQYSDEEGELDISAAERIKNSCYLTTLRSPLLAAMLVKHFNTVTKQCLSQF